MKLIRQTCTGVSDSSLDEMLKSQEGLIFDSIYKHPWAQFETTSGPFHTNDLDVRGNVSVFVPFVILKTEIN